MFIKKIRNWPGYAEHCDFIEGLWDDTIVHTVDFVLLEGVVIFLFTQGSKISDGHANAVQDWNSERSRIIKSLNRSDLEEWGLKYSLNHGTNLIRKPDSILSIRAGCRKHADALFLRLADYSCTMNHVEPIPLQALP